MDRRDQRDQRPDFLSYVLPRTVVGLAVWLLIFAVGVGASGVVFFVAYERRITDLEARITSVRSELEQKLSDAVTQLQNADRAIQGGVTGTGASAFGTQAARLLDSVSPSVGSVQGTDITGARTSGSAFVMNSTAAQSWLLTSYRILAGSVAAAEGLPLATSRGSPVAVPTMVAGVTPTVTVHIGGADHGGRVWSWDASHDLALVIIDVGSLRVLSFSDAVPDAGLGVWAFGAATGPPGATAAGGQVVTSTSRILATNAVFGPHAWGGPLVDGEGRVMGVLTASAAGTPPPPGPPAGSAVPVRLACLQVVVCPR
jgi:S1-C subfamily serine protease